MAEINYFGSIVKILEEPIPNIITDNILKVECRAQFIDTNQIVYLYFWGNLAQAAIQSYKINDYLMIEGFLSVCNNDNFEQINSKKIEITIQKFFII